MDPNQPEGQSSPKQLLAERLRQASNVLVTVRSNPSVDELAATIGLTLMLNKFGKHTTAVFSGSIPSTLEFLKPEDTLETNTDSLRDFIVSLDKSKADKLRYKVEENVVKIFITPYRTSISEKDLEFSQGDFNVDIVLALGVTQREELDQAITAHGRILHDATVATITAGQRESTIGNLNWQEPGASSLSEMLVSISEALQGGLIDSQIATAFLTGIVAETQRFSNPKTTPKVMTMAAQLMAAGANQQLIANELMKADEFQALTSPGAVATDQVADEAGSLSIPHEDKSEEKPVDPGSESGLEPAPLPLPLTEEKPKELAPSEPSESFEPLLPPLDEKPEESEPEPQPENQIHIDDDGNLHSQPPVRPKHKTIEPLSDQEKSGEPPTPEQPIATDESMVLPPLPDNSNQPTNQSTVADSQQTGPFRPDDNSTLLDIEKSVHSPHLDGIPAASQDHEDEARNAVQTAFGQADFDPSGQTRADLNAMPLGNNQPSGDNLPQYPPPHQPPEQPSNDDDMPSAPPVPPPMLPQS